MSLPTVSPDRDRVILALGQSSRDICLTPDEAIILADQMDSAATICEQWMAAGGQGELRVGSSRGGFVKSWDGKVNIRLDSIVDRESVPYKAARYLAGEIRAKVTEAKDFVTIQWR